MRPPVGKCSGWFVGVSRRRGGSDQKSEYYLVRPVILPAFSHVRFGFSVSASFTWVRGQVMPSTRMRLLVDDPASSEVR